MKLAVCSISSTASRKPPSEILGTRAVAALPSGFARRSSILSVSLAVDRGRVEFIQYNADQLALRATEACDDVLHAVVDVEINRQDRADAVGVVEQLAVGGAERHRRSVEDDQIVAATWSRLRDRLADRLARLGAVPRGIRQDRNSVEGLDRARSLAADAEPA